MNTSKSCFIIGLPAAGKTSYLAALAYSLEQQNIPTKLQWKSFSGNQQYLTKLAEKWLTAEPVDRTSFSLEQRSLSWCLSDDDDNKYNISFPDLSGETFQKQYVDREIDSALAKMIVASDGLILFINPQGIIEPTLISQLPLPLRENEKNDSSPKERNQKIDDPTVVQIIVLLQDTAYLLKGKRMPLVVIVSAWDVVENSFTTPEDFVMKHTSLLWQFLKANNDIFNVSYYGVSAQGGKIETSEQAEALIEQYENNPWMRMSATDNLGVKSHDITLPLWELLNKKME